MHQQYYCSLMTSYAQRTMLSITTQKSCYSEWQQVTHHHQTGCCHWTVQLQSVHQQVTSTQMCVLLTVCTSASSSPSLFLCLTPLLPQYLSVTLFPRSSLKHFLPLIWQGWMYCSAESNSRLLDNTDKFASTDTGLVSAMHTFGKYSGLQPVKARPVGTFSRCRGVQIGVQPTAVGRRR